MAYFQHRISHWWSVSKKLLDEGKYHLHKLTLPDDKGIIKKGSDKYRFTIPVVNPIEFCEQPIEFDPYLMGCYVGSEEKDFIIEFDSIFNQKEWIIDQL